MAIVVALLFKYFILEISKIPSGSMQPTLMGNPETGIFDRTVVDKLLYRLRDPERFEIVVFKHPLERSRIMVKRLVGMPGEQLKIEHGDLWTRPDGNTAWKVLRRPPAVQREMWKELDGSDPRAWTTVRGGQDWRIAGNDVTAVGEGALRFRADQGPVRDDYLDGYPHALLGRILVRDPSWGRNAVGDVRVEGELRALPGTTAITIELTEGQRTYTFRLPGPAAPAESAPELKVRDAATASERSERGESMRLSGRELSFAAENLDDRLALELDGQVLLSLEIDPSPHQEASVTIGVEGQGAELADLRVLRDIYYLAPEARLSWSIEIPERRYVMLGDNTQDSADSRLWKAKSYVVRPDREPEDSGLVTIRGNSREGGENPSFGKLPDGSSAVRFRDQWGEVHWFARQAIGQETLPGNEPLVPRELVLGRAVAVFWPLKPTQGIWRLGWLR